MDIIKAMYERNSVRRYTDEPLNATHVGVLNDAIEKVNSESGLNFSLVTNEPEAFSSKMASYGHFSGCTDYIVAAGEKGRDEDIGYYGEKLVLLAQSIGVNSCWVALSYNKGKVNPDLKKGEKVYVVISLGYGVNQGKQHTNKPLNDLCECDGEMPEWFKNAVKAAMTAPTAMNQQKFRFILNGDTVRSKALIGPYSKLDLGIVKYHFELGAGEHGFNWSK